MAIKSEEASCETSRHPRTVLHIKEDEITSGDRERVPVRCSTFPLSSKPLTAELRSLQEEIKLSSNRSDQDHVKFNAAFSLMHRMPLVT